MDVEFSFRRGFEAVAIINITDIQQHQCCILHITASVDCLPRPFSTGMSHAHFCLLTHSAQVTMASQMQSKSIWQLLPTGSDLRWKCKLYFTILICMSQLFAYLQYHLIQMSKSSKDARPRPGSQDKKDQKPVRKSSTVELEELKEKGKKVLKKIIPNQPLILIKKLVQKGADNFKKELRLNHQLLPSLTTNKIQSLTTKQSVMGNLNSDTYESSHFEQMNRQLTHTMLNFQSTLSEQIENSSNTEIVRLQTDKCYQHIPKQFFLEGMQVQFVDKLLTRDPRQASHRRDELVDHYDEVEFNVHQQVNYKMGIFMSFVSFLSSIGGLAELSIAKIKGSRVRNSVVKQIVIQRAARVNHLRRRKQQLQQCLDILNYLKGLKKIETKLILQVQTKGRITSLHYYPQYCKLHELVKTYCCPRMLCKYWDIAYYIERSYHDSFSRSLKNYLAQIIMIDEKQFTEVISPTKTAFATVSNTNLFNNFQGLDESYELQEEVELIIKHNIEKQIVGMLKQGINKCTYSTDQLCAELNAQLIEIENTLYAIITKTNMLLSHKHASQSQRKHALEKLTTQKYLRIVELWSERLKKVITRQVSIIDKALKIVTDLKEQPEKQQVISSYLMQVIYITFAFIDQSMGQLFSCRKFKQQESDSIRQLLMYQQQWKQLICNLSRYAHLWQQLTHHFSQEQVRSRVSQRITEGLLVGMNSSRRKIVQIMINSYNQVCVNKLPLRLHEQQWRMINIPPNFYNNLGEVLYGKSFAKEMQKREQRMLNSSLLLQKNPSLMSQNDSPNNNHSFDQFNHDAFLQLQVSETVVKIKSDSYKIISSTLGVIQLVQGYLEWADQPGEEEESVGSTVSNKAMQFFMMYNTHVKDLILNKAALNYGKIKSKSITGKHLLIAYSQLKFIKTVGTKIAQRLPNSKEMAEILGNQLVKTMGEISKKFRTILQLALRQSINKLVVDSRRDITSPVVQTTQIVTALTRSCEYVRQILMDDKQMGQFITVNWCTQYLQQIKNQYKAVYKQIMNSNGTRKSKDIDWSDNLYWKFKELEYLVHNLEEISNLIPNFHLITQQLELERVKLDRPQ